MEGPEEGDVGTVPISGELPADGTVTITAGFAILFCEAPSELDVYASVVSLLIVAAGEAEPDKEGAAMMKYYGIGTSELSKG